MKQLLHTGKEYSRIRMKRVTQNVQQMVIGNLLCYTSRFAQFGTKILGTSTHNLTNLQKRNPTQRNATQRLRWLFKATLLYCSSPSSNPDISQKSQMGEGVANTLQLVKKIFKKKKIGRTLLHILMKTDHFKNSHNGCVLYFFVGT